MRQHVLRNKEKIIEENRGYIAAEPKMLKGRWHSLFSDAYKDSPLYIEIGSGKGQFIVSTALANPDRIYLACEGAVNVSPRITSEGGGGRP